MKNKTVNNFKPIESYLVPDKDKIAFDEYTLFDRIIDLKLTAGYYDKDKIKRNESFYLRSDWEVVYPDQDITRVMRTGNVTTDRYQIRKCRMKPSIKIQFQNVTKSTSISIDIFISNFFLMDKSGKKLMNFTSSQYPLEEVEILMGYWGQFNKKPPRNWEEYKDFDNVPDGITHIKCGVQYVTTEKLPPDYDLCIHAWVGEQPYESASKTDVDTYEKASLTGEDNLTSFKSGSAIENLFFEHITRRFTKGLVLNRSLPKANGKLTPIDADLYGVRVYVTEAVKAVSLATLEEKKEDSEGNLVDKTLYFDVGRTAENTLANMLSLINPELKKKRLVNGDWIVFMDSESGNIKKIAESVKKVNGNVIKTNSVTKAFDNKLPAVYNINIDALATIVAPFYFVVDVFDSVKFESRYLMSNMVRYFMDGGSPNTFWVIQQTISFATVDDVNEMTLVCQAEYKGD